MTRSFADAQAYLFPRTNAGGKWSLAPTRALLERLGHPERHYPTIHVGGTNGKGSVATLVAAALQRAGWRVAIYTSPHLVDVRERMVVDGRPISPEAFAAWTAELRSSIETVQASFFEATTAMAFADFAARGAEIAVVEVGLGGRLDCTNVIDPLVSVVTSVGLEHTDYLGSSLETIAAEKAGIAKTGRPFVIGERDPRPADVLERAAIEVGARPIRVTANASYDGALGLPGAFQQRNAAIASVVLDALPDGLRPSAAARAEAFETARLPGRLDRRGKWLFDVAHNPSGVAVLVDALGGMRLPRPVHAVVGILRDKDWRTMLGQVSRVVDRLWITTPPTAPAERRWDVTEVGLSVPAATVEGDFDRALAEAAAHGATVLVTGSFHTVGDAMARLPGFAPFG